MEKLRAEYAELQEVIADLKDILADEGRRKDIIKEELRELKEVMENEESKQRREEEFGDVLFSLINYARFIDVDPETALERINQKFKRRFEYIEAQADRPLQDMSLEEMDALWNEAKTVRKN